MRTWSDQRARHLYSLATSSRDRGTRHEAVLFLGALERAGCDDAAWAMRAIRKQAAGGDTGSLS